MTLRFVFTHGKKLFSHVLLFICGFSGWYYDETCPFYDSNSNIWVTIISHWKTHVSHVSFLWGLFQFFPGLKKQQLQDTARELKDNRSNEYHTGYFVHIIHKQFNILISSPCCDVFKAASTDVYRRSSNLNDFLVRDKIWNLTQHNQTQGSNLCGKLFYLQIHNFIHIPLHRWNHTYHPSHQLQLK